MSCRGSERTSNDPYYITYITRVSQTALEKNLYDSDDYYHISLSQIQIDKLTMILTSTLYAILKMQSSHGVRQKICEQQKMFHYGLTILIAKLIVDCTPLTELC